MWSVERKEEPSVSGPAAASAGGQGTPGPGTGSETSATVVFVWRWAPSDGMGGRAGEGLGRLLHEGLTGVVLYSFEDWRDGIVMRVANWSVPGKRWGVTAGLGLMLVLVLGRTLGFRRKARSRFRSVSPGVTVLGAFGSLPTSARSWSLRVVKPPSKGYHR